MIGSSMANTAGRAADYARRKATGDVDAWADAWASADDVAGAPWILQRHRRAGSATWRATGGTHQQGSPSPPQFPGHAPWSAAGTALAGTARDNGDGSLVRVPWRASWQRGGEQQLLELAMCQPLSAHGQLHRRLSLRLGRPLGA